MVGDDKQETAARIAARLEVVAALVWASAHTEELLTIVTAAPTGLDGVRILTDAPYGFTQVQAHHILDLPFRRLSQQNVALLQEEDARLRRGEYSPTMWQP